MYKLRNWADEFAAFAPLGLPSLFFTGMILYYMYLETPAMKHVVEAFVKIVKGI